MWRRKKCRNREGAHEIQWSIMLKKGEKDDDNVEKQDRSTRKDYARQPQKVQPPVLKWKRVYEEE